MWAYYSDWGKGVCFELEWTCEVLDEHQLLLQPVYYTNAPRVLNQAEDWRAEFLKRQQDILRNLWMSCWAVSSMRIFDGVME